MKEDDFGPLWWPWHDPEPPIIRPPKWCRRKTGAKGPKGFSFFLILLLALICMGCSMTQVRERAVAWSESHHKNVEAAKTISANLKTDWPTVSGAIHAYYENRMDYDLPPRMVKSIERLDEITICGRLVNSPVPCDKPLPDAIDDFLSGYILGAHAAIAGEMIEVMIEEILEFFQNHAPSLWQTIIGII